MPRMPWSQLPAARSRLNAIAIICVAALAAGADAGLRADGRSSDAGPAASRFLARHDPPLRSYRCYRRLHASSPRFGQEAWLTASTELDHGVFRYRIVNERGSEYIRKKVLRAVLDHERELIDGGGAARGDLTRENYEFGAGGFDEDGARYVALHAKRKDVLLVNGRMVLSPDTDDLLRVEGRLSKNPSFWTSRVNIVREYGRVAGVRVPVSVTSTASIRFAGTGRLEMVYEYESVNGRPVTVAERR
ncbi:MAG TPA: hypothetical protein VFX12_07065 [Vicinamibacterales bacterium]|nr:hypothetical protein [Vicinamibacterales bacterium]